MSDTNLIPAPESPAPLVRLKRIVVTTDFSDASRQALPLDAEVDRQFGATRWLVVRHATCPVLVVHEREPGFLEG